MNRGIKFRAWNGHSIKYSDESYEIHYEKEGDEMVANSFSLSDFFKFLPIQPKMEYIGIKDKNGKEIFEGDIVRVKGRKKIGEYITEVIRHNTGFKLKENKTYLLDDYAINKTCEVIGNIIETPNLLK